MQTQLRQMLHEHKFTHWVTLNFHRQYGPKATKELLQKWFMDLNCRFFRAQRFEGVETPSLFFFFAFPENTRKEEPHFHLLVNLHEDRHDYFEALAKRLWKKLVPSGTSDVQRIKDSDDDRESVISYATKHANRAFSHDEFIASNMLKDGRRTCLAPLVGAQRHTCRGIE